MNKFLLLAISFTIPFVFPLNASAQDDDEFSRIATRIMNSYQDENADSLKDASLGWHGGAYLGASTQGRTIPSASFTYKSNEKFLFTGDIAGNITEKTTGKSVATFYNNGTGKRANTDILTNGQNIDAKVRFDYAAWKGSILTFGILESYNNTKEKNSSAVAFLDGQGVEDGAKYENRTRSIHDLKMGYLLQYIQKFESGDKLTTRVNIKHNHLSANVDKSTWAMSASDYNASREHHKMNNFDPYGLMKFQSRAYGAFSWGLSEKYTINRIRTEHAADRFNFNTCSSLSSLNMQIVAGCFSFAASGDYEYFDHRSNDFTHSEILKYYNNWMANAKASFAITGNHSIVFNFNRSVTHPEYEELDPYENIGSDITLIYMGNSDLEPSKSWLYGGGYHYKDNHLKGSISASFEHIKDDIAPVASHHPVTNQTIKTWKNDVSFGKFMFDARGEVTSGAFNMTFGARAQRLSYGSDYKSDGKLWSYSFKVRPQVELPGKWTLATSLLYQGRENHLTYYNRGYTYLSVRAVKQMGPWAIYGFVQDILERDRVQVLHDVDNTVYTYKDLNARALILGASYKF